jgi:hypothetical protein
MILQFHDLFQSTVIVNFKLTRSRSLNTNTAVVCLSSMPIFFSMKDILSIDKIPVIALDFSFRAQA